MKIVILSCNTGGGHNSAARAVQAALAQRGAEAEIVDALRFMPPIQSRVITKGHVFAYRKLPRLYGAGYRFEETHTPKGMYRQCAPAAEKLWVYLQQQGYDAAICVHVFPALMLTHIRREYFARLPVLFVATDYTCSPGVELTEVDGWCIPTGLTDEFVRCGLPKEKLWETGIPVAQVYYEEKDRQAARQALGLDPKQRQVVVSCGSMGCGPLRSLALLLAESLPEDTALTILCGSNRSLKRDLQILTRKPRVRVLGYTDQMPRWLAAADVLLSKPGGLTSTEAMTMGVPLVCIDAVPGCETRNLEFFCAHELALTARHVPGLVEATMKLLREPETRREMARRQRARFARPAAEAVAELALEKIQREKQGDSERLDRQFAFLREIDREKEIVRQTYLASASRKEGDAEHAWHLAIMTILLSEYANEEIDVLKTVSMVLIHDLVEIDAGDTYAYDTDGAKTQRERELAAAERIFGLLPEDQGRRMRALWDEFEARETPEAKFARTMDCVQPTLLNDASRGRSWQEHGVHLSQVLGRNARTAEGSQVLWEYAREHFIEPHVGKELKDD